MIFALRDADDRRWTDRLRSVICGGNVIRGREENEASEGTFFGFEKSWNY